MKQTWTGSPYVLDRLRRLREMREEALRLQRLRERPRIRPPFLPAQFIVKDKLIKEKEFDREAFLARLEAHRRTRVESRAAPETTTIPRIEVEPEARALGAAISDVGPVEDFFTHQSTDAPARNAAPAVAAKPSLELPALIGLLFLL